MVFISFITVIIGSLIYVFFFTRERSPQPPSTKTLKSLPYVAWVPARDIQKSGVTEYDEKRAFKGINLYCSRNLSEAYLMDMSGNILHKWSADINMEDGLHHVEVDENGDLLAIVKDKMLIRMDWHSRVKWIKEMRFHHDIAIAENGDLYALIRKYELVSFSSLPVPILNDCIFIMSPEGEARREISLFDALKEEIPVVSFSKIYRWINDPETIRTLTDQRTEYTYRSVSRNPLDIFHTNTIEIVERDIDGICKKGDLLLCVLKLNLVGILDIENTRLVWKWGQKQLDKPHHPTLLENGNILIFDNGSDRGYSRIVELDLYKKEIVWEYKSDLPERFFSISRGASQKLPNGNILITESDRGRAFEVTPSGETVWEFYNPEIKKDEKKRAAIYRMMRLFDAKKYPFLKMSE